MMVNPKKFNVINESRTNLKFNFTITNVDGNTFDITDCYQKVTYDDTVSTISPIVNTELTDCAGGGKCGTINVLLQGCSNSKTMIIPMAHADADLLIVGDVISAAYLAALPNFSGLIIPSQGIDTCYTVGGQANSVTSSQTANSAGVGWTSTSYKYSSVTDCTDLYCGCKSGFTVNNIGGVVQLVNVKTCDESVVNIDIPASGSVTVSDCINMNSFWSKAAISGSFNNLSIAIGAYDDCSGTP